MRDVLRRLGERPAVRRVGAGVLVVVLLFVGWLATDPSASSESKAPVARPEATTTQAVPNWDPVEPDVSWQEMAGIDLPVSRLAGPYRLTDARASGFSHDAPGAALAAAHILARTFPGVGSDSFVPTIQEQVTGTAKGQLASRTQQAYDQAAQGMQVEAGQPLPLGQGWVVAYRLVDGAEAPTTDARTVQVLIEGSGEYTGFTEYTVDLVWSGEDWQAVAPTWGDWSSVARSVRNPYPTSYRAYDDITSGAGETS